MIKNRHLKSKRKETWTDLRTEIKRVCEEFNIPKQEFSEVNINFWEEIETKVWEKFSSSPNSRWIWQTLKVPYSTTPIDYNTFSLVEYINPIEKVWILLEESLIDKVKFWVYEGATNIIDKILWKTEGIGEILIVSKKYEWILIINHHNIMIGTGELRNKIDNAKV